MRIRWDVVMVAAVIVFVSCVVAFATECPPNPPNIPPGCKVLTLNTSEEAILVQQNGILETAAQGRKLELEGATMYFRQRIKEAPAGEVRPTGPTSPGTSTAPQQ